MHASLAERFADAVHSWRREGPVMVCELVQDEAMPGIWRERSRGFVVPDDWEARAALRAGAP